jgi:hypothetical protein
METTIIAVNAKPKPKRERIALECLECGKKFSVGLNNYDPECPKCGGVDYEVR